MNKTLPSFEQLREMALQDPESLERLRKEYIDAAINTAPIEYRSRLEGLQFQIDGQRRLSKTPMAACINISKMMHQSLDQLHGLIDGQEVNEEPKDNATVLSFQRPIF